MNEPLKTAEPQPQPQPQFDVPAQTPRAGVRLISLSLVATLLIAVAGYLYTGTPSASSAVAAAPPAAEGDINPAQFAEMVDKLAARLKERPDPVGYSMLGRSYLVLGRNDESVAAYRQAIALKGDDAALMADMADAVAMQNGGRLDGEALEWIERALKIEPAQLKALSLRGAAAYQRHDYATAAKSWDRVVAIGPVDSQIVQGAREGAEQARQAGKLGAAAVPAASSASAAPTTPATAASTAGAVSGTVNLSPALQAQAAPEDTVFIFARAPEGSRMPLAIVRKQVKDLPYAFKLDDAMAMSPQATLSGAGRVVIGARISKSGQAMPQAGDLEGLSPPVAVGSEGVAVTISDVRR